MSVGKGGQTGNQSGSQSGNFTGATTGTDASSTTQNGTQTGTQSGTQTGTQTGSITPTTTAGWQSVDGILRGNLGTTGLNAGQTGAYDTLNNWTTNPNNTVSQIGAGNGQLQNWVGQQAPQILGTGDINAPSVAANAGSQFMDAYRNPYTDQVVNATGADMEQAFKQGLNDINANYGGTMGNGRAGVAAGQALGDYGRAVGTTLGGIRSQGFDTAANLGSTDAARFLSAAQGNQATALDATKTTAANALDMQKYNASLDAQKQMANVQAMQGIINNAVTAGNVGTDTLKALYDMSGGGNSNLATYMGLQPTGSSSTGTSTGATTGTTSGTTSGTSNTTGSQSGTTAGSSSGYNSGSSSGKNGGLSL